MDTSADANTSETEQVIEAQKPLYEGAPLTVKSSLCAILTFAQSEHLAGTSLARLLRLIELHLPSPNNFVKSTYQFFKCLEQIDFELKTCFYCNICWGSRTSVDDICTSCTNPKRKVDQFISVPMTPQIIRLYKRERFSEKLKHRFKRRKIFHGNIEDVYDAKVYKEVAIGDGSISLMWYTDGIALYECSSYSLWPFFFIMNELPPTERYKPENLILAGLWGSADKPHPNVFLQHISHELLALQKGIQVKLFDDTELTVSVCVVCGTCDSPAKASFFNFKSHSGYSSCPVCLIEGEKSARSGDVMVFPHEEVLTLRTKESYIQDVKESVRSKTECNGVKGPTLLHYFLTLFICSSTAIDSMHCLYLGLMKQLLNLWFNSVYHTESFSLSKQVKEVNRRLSELRFPHFVQRLPVDVDKLAFWKASLCRTFLLHVGLIVLKGIMKDEYYNHFALLVQATALLNSSSISTDDLKRANDLLNSFSKDFQVLYGIRHMSYNLHVTRRLAFIVEQTGNLWVTSCFPFEDLNGKLANLAHGTREAGLQIANNLHIFSSLQTRAQELEPGPVQEYCMSLLHKRKKYTFNEKVAHGIFLLGVANIKLNIQM